MVRSLQTRRRFITLSACLSALVLSSLTARHGRKSAIPADGMRQPATNKRDVSPDQFYVIDGWVVHADQFRTHSAPAEWP